MNYKMDSHITNLTLKSDSYFLTSLLRVVFARFFDYLLISVFIFVLSFLLYQDNNLSFLTKAVINHLLTILLLVLYFIIFPYFFFGKTLGKIIFRFQLVRYDYSKLKIYHLLYRELFITFIPWMILVVSNLTISLLFKYSIFNFDYQSIFLINSKTKNAPEYIKIILRVVSFFYLGWYASLLILYKIDPWQQLFFDRLLNIYVINIKPKDKISGFAKQETTQKKHIHLETSMPAIIDEKIIEEINKL